MVYVPNWFSVDLKTGVSLLVIKYLKCAIYDPHLSLKKIAYEFNYCNPIYIREYKFSRFAEVGHIREY
jgi:hypothetical protein